jgi:epoxyqueuosine reductase QueG
MDKLTKQITKSALANGAAVVGFAPLSRYDDAPAEYHPRTIFPQAKSIIGMLVPQLRGTLKAIEEGTYWQSYNCDSYFHLNDVLSPFLLRAVALLLEDYGYTAVPVHNPFYNHLGKKIRDDMPNGPDGMLSLRMLAVLTGLGELGKSKIFLSPQFGPRQRIYGVLTDAELEPTPLFRGKICDDCDLCISGCQANAISKQRTVTLTVEGQEYSHADLDAKACHLVHKGKDSRFSPFITGESVESEEPVYYQRIYERYRHLSVCGARGCIRSCLDHLERKGRIEKKFKLPFISHQRWSVPQ